MSLDTSLADPISNLSPWQRILFQQIAEREMRIDALRRQMPVITNEPKTPAELRADIAKYNGWLDTTPVQAGGQFLNWVRERKADALRQLANLTTVAGGAR